MTRLDAGEERIWKSKIASLAERVAAATGMEVVLVELKVGGRSVVRVFIDRPGGVSLADCERFSKRLSVMLDVEDFLPFRYVLEVSSPGLDRPLTREEDFRRFAGRDAKVRLRSAAAGRRSLQGKILGVDHGRVRFELPSGDQVEVAVAEIERANLVIEI